MSGGFTYKYLCILDPGCRLDKHSLRCKEMNNQRHKSLKQKERERRLRQMRADIEGDYTDRVGEG